MDDFLFSLEMVKAEILEDFRQYFPEGYKKTKPMVHWGVEFEIKFMDEEIPEQPGMLSRRFIEITLRANEEPTSAIIARELIMRGGHSVGAASMKARDGWWKGQKPVTKKEPTIQEEADLVKKTGHTYEELEAEESQQALPDLELGKAVKAAIEKPRSQRKPRTKRKSH